MICTLTVNPCIDITYEVLDLKKDDANRAVHVMRDPGGKGINVSRVLQRLGAPTLAIAVAGGHTGKLLGDLLDEENVKHRLVPVPGDTRLGIILTDLREGTQTRVSAPGPNMTMHSLDELRRTLHEELGRSKMMVCGGTLPPGVPLDLYNTLVEDARAKGVPVVVDTDGELLIAVVQAKPFLIKPNVHELSRLVERTLHDRNDVLRAGKSLLDKGLEQLVVSMGKDGAFWIDRRNVFHGKGPDVRAESSVGAGDSMIAGILYGLYNGMAPDVALRWGVAAGTAAVITRGTVLCHPEDVHRMYEQCVITKVE
ncbi:MAG: Tagatose-6-phosphate kinase [Myxococcota bacterium]|nr:Tagatose-6-phosphate kinase [Myxococcota bacterium]